MLGSGPDSRLVVYIGNFPLLPYAIATESGKIRFIRPVGALASHRLFGHWLSLPIPNRVENTLLNWRSLVFYIWLSRLFALDHCYYPCGLEEFLAPYIELKYDRLQASLKPYSLLHYCSL